MNTLDKIFEKSHQPKDYAKDYLIYLSELLRTIDPEPVAAMIEALIQSNKEGKRIYFIGNGGSAATASHFANDIGTGTRCPKTPFKAISLCDNNAVLTAIGNDEGYEYIFTKQLEVLMEPGDVVVAISASGNSPNIIHAVQFAKSKKNLVIGLSGFDGGELKKLSDICLHVPTPKGEYGPVEDLHMVFDHLIGTYLYRYVRK